MLHGVGWRLERGMLGVTLAEAAGGAYRRGRALQGGARALCGRRRPSLLSSLHDSA